MNANLPDIMTPEQAADYLQVNRETIYRYIRAGKLVASHLGRDYRITRRSLNQLLVDNRTRPDIPLREYTDQELADFLEADRLDDEALAMIRHLRERPSATRA